MALSGSGDCAGAAPPPTLGAASAASPCSVVSPVAAPPSAPPAPSAPQVPGVAPGPLSPSPAPALAPRIRWADLADEEPLPAPAGASSPQASAPRRAALPCRAGGPAPRVRGSVAGSRPLQSPTPPSSSSRVYGMQGASLRVGGARRRRLRLGRGQPL
nr:vegetative cell wall protein gp1-like [Aegilops tauschii subsp. strangulata]